MIISQFVIGDNIEMIVIFDSIENRTVINFGLFGDLKIKLG